MTDAQSISIHALLAESDINGIGLIVHVSGFLSTLSLRRATRCRCRLVSRNGNFYPRSPCGERPQNQTSTNPPRRFLSTLSLRRATTQEPKPTRQNQFLSTLSLRRATCRAKHTTNSKNHFYPRSPCGERLRRDIASMPDDVRISIHALLAESDSWLDAEY